jgi:hypothetical protein
MLFVVDSHASSSLQSSIRSPWLTATRPGPSSCQHCLVTCQQEFELAAYQGDAGAQLAALRKCAALSSIAADTLLEMCELSRGEEQLPLLGACNAAVNTRQHRPESFDDQPCEAGSLLQPGKPVHLKYQSCLLL